VSNSARDAVLATGATFADRLAPCGYDFVQVPGNKDQLETNASRLVRLESRQLRDGSIDLFADNTALIPGGFAEPGKSPAAYFARERKQPISWRIQQ
jgi:hypothetical protein